MWGMGGIKVLTAEWPGPALASPVVIPAVVQSHRAPPAPSSGSDLLLHCRLCGLGQATEPLWASVSPPVKQDLLFVMVVMKIN